jgi:hypothetical protein
MSKRLFFSLEGIDLNDDDALEAFAHRIWEQATAAWAKPDIDERPETDD